MGCMDGKELAYFRKKLSKTQEELARLFGTWVKAIQGYEQGWRSVSAHLERQLFFPTAMATGKNKVVKSGYVPVTKQLPYDWHNTPNIRVIALRDFREFSRTASL